MILSASLIFLSVIGGLIIKEFILKDKTPNIHGVIGCLIAILLLIHLTIAILFRSKLGGNYLLIHRIGAIFIVGLLLFQVYLGVTKLTKLEN